MSDVATIADSLSGSETHVPAEHEPTARLKRRFLRLFRKPPRQWRDLDIGNRLAPGLHELMNVATAAFDEKVGNGHATPRARVDLSDNALDLVDLVCRQDMRSSSATSTALADVMGLKEAGRKLATRAVHAMILRSLRVTKRDVSASTRSVARAVKAGRWPVWVPTSIWQAIVYRAHFQSPASEEPSAFTLYMRRMFLGCEVDLVQPPLGGAAAWTLLAVATEAPDGSLSASLTFLQRSVFSKKAAWLAIRSGSIDVRDQFMILELALVLHRNAQNMSMVKKRLPLLAAPRYRSLQAKVPSKTAMKAADIQLRKLPPWCRDYLTAPKRGGRGRDDEPAGDTSSTSRTASGRREEV